VNVALAVVAGIAIGGGVLAVSARDVRGTILGVLIVFLAAPLIADPWPSTVAILARVAAALLAARLMTIGLRGEDATGGTRIGWPAEALAAGAAAVIGFGSHGLGADALGPAEAQAAGFALIALAVGPLVTGRDVLRLEIGSVLLVMGAVLVQVGLDAPASDGEQLVVGLLTIGLGGAAGAISAAARAAGGLAVANVPAGMRGPRLPDAHRDIAPPQPMPERSQPSRPRTPGMAGSSGAPAPEAATLEAPKPEAPKPRRSKPAAAQPESAEPATAPAPEPSPTPTPAPTPTPTPSPKPKPAPKPTPRAARPRPPKKRPGGTT